MKNSLRPCTVSDTTVVSDNTDVSDTTYVSDTTVVSDTTYVSDNTVVSDTTDIGFLQYWMLRLRLLHREKGSASRRLGSDCH